MAAKLFSSQNQSSSSERDSLTTCNMHLTLCNMQKILHSYSKVKQMGIFYVYNNLWYNRVLLEISVQDIILIYSQVKLLNIMHVEMCKINIYLYFMCFIQQCIVHRIKNIAKFKLFALKTMKIVGI